MSSYDEWNGALAEVVFPLLPTPQPVYLSLDEEQQRALAAMLGLEQAALANELASAVRQEMAPFDDHTSLFESIDRRVGRWRWASRSKRGAPPILPLLTLLVLASDRMAHGEGMSETNFYGRVIELLDRPAWKQRFENAYRRRAENYWALLDRWLEDQDGMRGLPTAVAVGHRYVGLPISQALMRAADRAKLPSFFVHWGLPPGATVPPSELEAPFGQWIQRDPAPVSAALIHQWRSTALRQRILDIVATGLATWDGHLRKESTDASTQGARLAMQVGAFPRVRVSFTPVAHLADSDIPRSGEVKTTEGWGSVELTPFGPGIMRLGDGQTFDNQTLLEGVLEVVDSASGQHIVRTPRRIMVFRRVEMAGAYIEADQVMLGEEVFVVARDEPRIIRDIESVLSACARPGWQRKDEGYGGLPVGWVLFSGVQMFSDPGDLIRSDALDLRALVPLTKSQLLVSGGYSLPGSVRGKWHVDALPEVRAVSDNPKGFTLRLLHYADAEGDSDSPTLLDSWTREEPGALVIDLADRHLRAGNYRVELVPGRTGTAESSVILRVRHGGLTDERQRDSVEAADQFLDDPLSVVYASEPVGDPRIAGAVLSDVDEGWLPQRAAAPEAVHWMIARSARTKATLQLETVPSNSCLYTGAHRTDIETVPLDGSGRPLVPFVTGTCRVCGITRRFPSTPWRAKKRAQRGTPRPTHAPRTPALASIDHAVGTPRWDLVLDAVRHCGGGTERMFSQIAMYAEPSALMADHLIRTLAALGHIDLLRDPTTLSIISWDIAPAALVPTPSGWFLSGTWPKATILAQQELDPGLHLGAASHKEAPTSYFFDRVPNTLLEGVVVAGSALEMAAPLPTISEVVEALPRIEATPRVAGLTVFDVNTAKWADATTMRGVGGYRIRRFTTDDVLRTPQDLDNHTMARSTVHLSKHAAAALLGAKPLIAYDRQTHELRVPLGANLPGLYERAVVLASGLSPRPDRGSLVYDHVPRDLAAHIAYLLTH